MLTDDKRYRVQRAYLAGFNGELLINRDGVGRAAYSSSRLWPKDLESA